TPRQHSPEDLEALLAHLAPELERLAKQLDPNPPPSEPAPAPHAPESHAPATQQTPASSTESTRSTNSGHTTHSSSPPLNSEISNLESDISSLISPRQPILTGPHEHWP
ncbi:MAG TPA: hypothetical protein PKE29_18615, partial [Phycisphaerales bacterium]|nr:hypothetical protein [Phycisphaerales bacterium]